MIFVVVGLSFALSELRKTDVYTASMVTPKTTPQVQNGKHVKDQTAHFSGADKVLEMEVIKVNPVAESMLREYTKALNHYEQSHFKAASDIFGKIMATQPHFAKRLELYDLWIVSLQKTGEEKLLKKQLQKVTEQNIAILEFLKLKTKAHKKRMRQLDLQI